VTRRRRILVELLGPPLVATLLSALVAIARGRGEIPDGFFGGALVVLAVAYVVAGIPSVLFTIVMEVAFAKGLDPSSWGTVPLAAGLGLLSGMGIVGFDPSYGAFEGLAIVGLSTGAILGLLVMAGSRRARQRQPLTSAEPGPVPPPTPPGPP
jgi:hypothetical protein